jgi:hypothetical protein
MDDAGAPTGASPAQLLHEASYKIETREVPVKLVANLPQATKPKSTDRPVTAAKPASGKSVETPGLAAAKSRDKKSVDKTDLTSAKPVTKPVRIAKTDPLAPLPTKQSAKLKDRTTAQ